MRLHADEALDGRRGRGAHALEQELAREKGTIQSAPIEYTGALLDHGSIVLKGMRGRRA